MAIVPLAAAKIRNGVVEKVVVIKSGRGYIDPIAFVRAGPPHFGINMDPENLMITRGFTTYQAHWKQDPNKLHDDRGYYVGIPHNHVERIWRCTNLKRKQKRNF